jgi:hypothetical protein
VAEPADAAVEIEMDSCCGGRPYRRRGVDLEVVNCDESEETVAALAPSLKHDVFLFP